MHPVKTYLSGAAGLVAVVGALGLAGCAPDAAPAGRTAQALSPGLPPVSAPESDHAAWVEQVVPALLGRPVRGYGELKFLAVAATLHGRSLVAERLMNEPAFIDRWTGVLLDRLRVDRTGGLDRRGCYQTPLLGSDAARMTAAHLVLHTRRAGHDMTIDPTEPAAPAAPGTYNMADVVRGSLLIDNLFPAYRGALFTLATGAVSGDEESDAMRRRRGDQFMQVFANKSIICLNCHRSTYSCSSVSFTPGYAHAVGQESRVLAGIPVWDSPDVTDPPSDSAWAASFMPPGSGTVPFAGLSPDCGTFGPDSSLPAGAATGLLQGEAGASLWGLDARLKEGYLAQRAAYPTTIDTGAGLANQGRTLGAYWLAAAVANDVWREVFGAPLTIAHFASRNEDEQAVLWNLAESQVIARDFSLRGLLSYLVTSPYFSRLPSATPNVPKVFEPFIDTPTTDYVGDVVQRRSADALFRMKTKALGWTRPVSHFPGAATYPSLEEAHSLGLYLSTAKPASATSSQQALLAWEASAGRCQRPADVTRDWIDALDARASSGGVSVRGAVEALRYRLLSRGLTSDPAETTALQTFLGRALSQSYAAAFPGGAGVAALRRLCEVFVKTPHFMLQGVPYGRDDAATNFNVAPELQVGDLRADGTLESETPEEACARWQPLFTGVGLDCTNVAFPLQIWWLDAMCPRGRCILREDLIPRRPSWPCLSCPFDPREVATRPLPIDPRPLNAAPPTNPLRAGTLLAWAEGAKLLSFSGTVMIVRRNEKSELPQVGAVLAIGDSVELGGGAKAVLQAPDGLLFQTPSGGMPQVPGTPWVFMVTGQGGLPVFQKLKTGTLSIAQAKTVGAALAAAARNEEPGSASFVHVVSAPSGNSSYLDHPALNGKPDRVVLVSAQAGAVTNNRATGVWYNAGLQRWAIYNEDLAAMPTGARFSVRAMAPSATAFVHRVTSANRSGHITYLSSPELDGRPALALQVAHVYNPPGVAGVYNNHAVGVWYDGGRGQWAIYNDDLAALPLDAAFAVKVGGYRAVTASAATRVGNAVVIDDAALNGAADARVFLTHNYAPPGTTAAYHNRQSALRYDGALGRWTVVNLDGTQVANNVSFNLHRGY